MFLFSTKKVTVKTAVAGLLLLAAVPLPADAAEPKISDAIKDASDTFTAPARAKLVGKIVDAATGKPVADAAVKKAVAREFRQEWMKKFFFGHYLPGKSPSLHSGTFYDEAPKGDTLYYVWSENHYPVFVELAKGTDKYRELAIKLEKGEKLAFQITTPQGKVAANAQVGILPPKISGAVGTSSGEMGKGASEKEKKEWFLSNADASGNVVLRPCRDDHLIFVTHETGYASARPSDLRSGKSLALTPWGQVKGKAIFDGKILSSRTITLRLSRRLQEQPNVAIFSGESAVSDKEGNFEFKRALHGLTQISVLGEKEGESFAWLTPVFETLLWLEQGKSVPVDLSKTRRPVSGKVSASNVPAKSAKEKSNLFFSVATKEYELAKRVFNTGKDISLEEMKKMNGRPYCEVAADKQGVFQIPNGLLPGKYVLVFWASYSFNDGNRGRWFSGRVEKEIEVPAIIGDAPPKPLILPTVEIPLTEDVNE
ncbi:MAG: hypothetical protein LBT53_04900 [Puniceicoccales bacterium]|jgi:hypothetical protein|nr:hypothetical protein [Puniceicoccales bacterium]